MTQLPKAKFRKDYTPPEFTITDVDLTFDLHPTETRIRSVLTVIRQGKHGKPLVLDGDHLTLLSVMLNGEVLSDSAYHVTEHSLTIDTALDTFTLEIENRVNPTANEALEGLYFAENTFCTQCEAEGFRRMTYYLDRPDVLAKFTTTIIADASRFPYLLSNGNRIEHRQLDNGKHLATWQDPYPKPSYLFAVVAGDFDVLEDTFTTKDGRSVALELFVDKGNLDRADHAMLSLKNAMKWDEDRFDLVYDLDVYMVVAVDFFNMGAMENKGLNVFNAKYVLANPKTATDQDFLNVESVIGHEYFHNWTGNRVTCRDWFQLSLKEGLTVFRDQEFSSDLGSRAVNRIQDVKVIRSLQFAEDAGPMAHPIRPDKVVQMNNFYTVTVYNKGAEVIRMIHTLLGEAGFQNGLKCYFERHDGQAVTCENFIAAMEDANGVDFTTFRRWYSQSGTPTVTVNEDYDPDLQRLTLTLSQTTETQPQNAPFHIPVAYSAYTQKGVPMSLGDTSVLELTETTAQWVFNDVAEKPILSLFDNFSAPIKVKRSVTDDELRVLMAHCTDDFNRWDAAQSLFSRIIQRAIDTNKPVALDNVTVSACQNLLHADTDPALKALALTLPTAATLADHYECIPVDAIDTQLRTLKQALAQALEADFATLLTHSHSGERYDLSGDSIAQRQLKQVCLNYLAEQGDVADQALLHQFDNADNLTDQLGALQAAVWTNHHLAESLLNQFETQWRGEKLVMDKWFSTQALANNHQTVERVNDRMTHPDFSLKNPNRVYSLLAAFTQNQPQFHRQDGAGYRLVSSVIEQLNTSNPQVASRLLSAFVSWRRYDESRQALMHEQLTLLRKLPNLASDLSEKIESCLTE